MFVRDLASGTTIRASEPTGGGEANGPSASPVTERWTNQSPLDVQWVTVFESNASNLVPNDLNGATDVFAKLSNGQLRLVSRGLGGAPAAGASASASMSKDGRYVTFSSTAPNLVAGDANGDADLFLHDLSTGAISRISVTKSGAEPNDVSNGSSVAVSSQGQPIVVYDTAADNLAPGADVDAAFDLVVQGAGANADLVGTAPALAALITADGPDASVVGQAYTVEVVITGPDGPPPPGALSVADSLGGSCGPVRPNPQGVGTCALTSNTAGSRTLIATFAADALPAFGTAQDTEPHAVGRASTRLALVEPDFIVTGAATSFESTLSVVAPGAGAPGGSIAVSAGAGENCTIALPATACAITFASVGPRLLTLTYAGNANFVGTTLTRAIEVLAPGDPIFRNGFE